MYFIFELVTALIVYGIRLEKQEKFKKCLLVAAIMIGGSIVILQRMESNIVFKENMLIRSYFGFFLFLTIIFILMITSILLLFRVSLQEAIYCATCAYLTEHIAYCFRILLNEVASKPIAQPGSFLYFTIYIILYVAAYHMIAKWIVKDKHYVTSAVQSLGFMVCVLFLVVGMSCIATAYDFETIHAIYAIFCCGFVLYSQEKYQKQRILGEELNIQQQLWLHHKAQYQISKENIEIVNQKCHDLKYQISALKTMENTKQRQEAIDSIEASILIYDSMLKTGNSILDTVLTEKSLICNQKNIIMNCIVDGKLLEFMEVIDLYTLFGNAFDNAIEGVLELPSEERYITLLLHEKADLIFIQIENGYRGVIKIEDGVLVTSKKNTNYHGFGLKSVRHIVEKYQGFITIETENDIFLLRITIPANMQVRT